MPSVRGHTVTDLMARRGHEQVVFVADADAGLRAVIAIHSTALGPSLGGVRFRDYATDADALDDVLRLSEAMSLKAAISGLHQGGGKAVVRWDDPDRPRPQVLLDALGRAIDDLGGRYLAAEDVGATTADMNGLARVTPWVTGVDEVHGGSGDPSPVTAYGVMCAMRATMAELDGEPTLRDRHVVVQGVGHVGAHLTAPAGGGRCPGHGVRRLRDTRRRVGSRARCRRRSAGSRVHDAVRHPCPLRTGRRARRRRRRALCAVVPSSARPTTNSVPPVPTPGSRSAGSSTRPTSW